MHRVEGCKIECVKSRKSSGNKEAGRGFSTCPQLQPGLDQRFIPIQSSMGRVLAQS